LDCIFCQIANGKIPSQKVYEDEDLFAFHDIQPAAPTHVLVIPKKHLSTLMDVTEEDGALIGKIFIVIKKVAKQLGLDEAGFRVVNNMGEQGGQTVYHLHFHLLGGRELTWPPG
jgi:histidine triad (HIT) family protein